MVVALAVVVLVSGTFSLTEKRLKTNEKSGRKQSAWVEASAVMRPVDKLYSVGTPLVIECRDRFNNWVPAPVCSDVRPSVPSLVSLWGH